MGFEESHGQEERLLPLRQVLEGLHGQSGQSAVGIGLVRQIGHLGGGPLAAFALVPVQCVVAPAGPLQKRRY